MIRCHTIEEAASEMATQGIKNAVFVQCYNDCPEEVDWVYEQVEVQPVLTLKPTRPRRRAS